jgi:hypothetical protein
MSQVVFKLPVRRKPPGPRAAEVIKEGFQANVHCRGRGANPWGNGWKAGCWDEGWCEAELIDLPQDRRSEVEAWLAGGNE